jgi:hypothetical protein
MTDEELRALDERIARALGWVSIPADGVDRGDWTAGAWALIEGRSGTYRTAREGPPAYSTDAALLPEMWAECERRRWDWTATRYEARDYPPEDAYCLGCVWRTQGGAEERGRDPNPVTAFARAFDAAITAQEAKEA